MLTVPRKRDSRAYHRPRPKIVELNLLLPRRRGFCSSYRDETRSLENRSSARSEVAWAMEWQHGEEEEEGVCVWVCVWGVGRRGRRKEGLGGRCLICLTDSWFLRVLSRVNTVCEDRDIEQSFVDDTYFDNY